MWTYSFVRRIAVSAIAAAATAMSGLGQAQDLGDALLEEIIVTATKRAGGIEAQQAAVARVLHHCYQRELYVHQWR